MRFVIKNIQPTHLLDPSKKEREIRRIELNKIETVRALHDSISNIDEQLEQFKNFTFPTDRYINYSTKINSIDFINLKLIERKEFLIQKKHACELLLKMIEGNEFTYGDTYIEFLNKIDLYLGRYCYMKKILERNDIENE